MVAYFDNAMKAPTQMKSNTIKHGMAACVSAYVDVCLLNFIQAVLLSRAVFPSGHCFFLLSRGLGHMPFSRVHENGVLTRVVSSFLGMSQTQAP